MDGSALVRKFIDISPERPYQRAIHVKTTSDSKKAMVDALLNILINDIANSIISVVSAGTNFTGLLGLLEDCSCLVAWRRTMNRLLSLAKSNKI